MNTLMGVSSARKTVYALGVTAVLLIEFLARDVILPPSPGDVGVRLSLLIEWALLLALLFFWLPRVERKPLATMGVTAFRWRYLAVGIIAYIVALIPISLASYVLDRLGLPTLRSLQPALGSYRAITLIGLFLTGTILEELLYRGYLIERLALLGGRPWLAGAVSWLVFTLVHVRFVGLVPLIEISILTAVLVFIYLRERSVWPCIVCHGFNNLLAYVIFPLFILR